MPWKLTAILACGLLAGAAVGQDAPPKQPATSAADIKTARQKVSYGFGMNIGKNIERQGLKVDGEMLMRGIRDALSGKDPAVPEAELQAALEEYQAEMEAAQKAEGQANLEKAEDFLAEHKSAEGVKVTKSGLQYKVLKAGDGKTPTADDIVRVHYKGTLLDGKTFDSSYDRGEPAEFPVGGVIDGWTEALQLMKAGSKWQLWIPPALAYGENPRPGSPIPANALLVFEVELLEVMPQEKPEGPQGLLPPGSGPKPKPRQTQE